MFTIQKAILANNTEFNEITLKEAGLSDKTVRLSSKGTGLTFHDADGSLFCFARFSKRVKENIINKKLTLEQILAYCKISASEYEGETYYSLTIPEQLRGGTTIGVVKELVKKAKPLAPKAVQLADISALLSLD